MIAQGQRAISAAAPTQIVPLYVATNRPLAMLTIGDGAPSPVAFDTGTDANILDTNYAKRMGLKVTGSASLTDGATGKTVQVPTATAPGASLSGSELSDGTVQILDHRRPDEVGVFGPNAFGDRYVVIEAGLGRVRIMPKDSGFLPPGPGHPYKDGLPSAEIAVDGHHYDAALDTGSDSALILGSGLLQSTRLIAKPTVVGIARTAFGDTEQLGGTIAGSLVVGPYRVANPPVTFGLSGSGANIGFPVIRHLTIVLDPRNKRSWVLDPAAERPVWSDYVGRFGPRSITLKNARLIYQRIGRPHFQLQYLGADLFEIGETGDRLQFFRHNGRVDRLELITADGEAVREARQN